MTFCDYCKMKVKRVVHIDEGMDMRACLVCFRSMMEESGYMREVDTRI